MSRNLGFRDSQRWKLPSFDVPSSQSGSPIPGTSSNQVSRYLATQSVRTDPIGSPSVTPAVRSPERDPRLTQFSGHSDGPPPTHPALCSPDGIGSPLDSPPARDRLPLSRSVPAGGAALSSRCPNPEREPRPLPGAASACLRGSVDKTN